MEDEQVELSHLDVEARDERGWTNVHIAVHNNRPEVLDFLLKRGASVRVYNDNGESPLHFAASVDSQSIACALLKRLPRDQVREYIDSRTRERGTSALHVAAKNGAFGIVWLLLSYGADFEIKNKADKRPIDATREARIERLLKTVELDAKFAEQRFPGLRSRLQSHPFFELDATLHARNERGWTILQVAVMNGDVEVAEKIVELRTVKEKDEPPPIELLMCLSRLAQCCDDMKAQLNCLLKMCNADEVLEAEAALEEGTRLLSTASKVTRLFVGEQQHLQVLDETLEVLQFDGGKTDESARYYRKLCTSNKSELYSFLDILKLTIGAPIALLLNTICAVYLGSNSQRYDLTSVDKTPTIDVNLNKQDANGWTPLHYAVHNDKEDMVGIYLDLKSDATLVTKKNRKTPLHMAVKNGNARIVELLLRRVKVDGYVDEKSEPKGLTALHFAAKMGRLDLVKCLIGGGANYEVRDKKGRSALELAKDAEVVEFLRFVDEIFEKVEKSDFLRKLEGIEREDLLVIANARNNEARTLTAVAKLKCEREVYSELLTLVGGRENKEST